MAYIKTGIHLKGLAELLFYKSTTGRPLANFIHAILKGKSGLTAGERELIATHVSNLNQCVFCTQAHSTTAAQYFEDGGNTVQCVLADPQTAPISEKMKFLLYLAGKVQQSGQVIRPEDIQEAHTIGATDEDIHDTILIASAFCMLNRYVDALGVDEPNVAGYRDLANRFFKSGYKYPPRLWKNFVVKMLTREQSK